LLAMCHQPSEVGTQNDESRHKEVGGVNSNLSTYAKKINMVYGFPKLTCTEAVWDKFIPGENKF